ncbi:hypothetical protein AAG570_013961 [Ranatra chinensis]|uniref:C2H2-type domain-containing protein n=1 Tax=Ranatra chinensis TaxID=642074 RepID=A0ABD0YDP9_9HEMI
MTIRAMVPEGGRSVSVCPKCGKGYSNSSNLNRHLRFECGKERQFSCPHCQYRARHKTHLQSHISCKHWKYSSRGGLPEEEAGVVNSDCCISSDYVCQRCGKGYMRKSTLNRHMRYECGGKRTFQCPMCYYAARHRNHLQSHMVSKHKPPIVMPPT